MRERERKRERERERERDRERRERVNCKVGGRNKKKGGGSEGPKITTEIE